MQFVHPSILWALSLLAIPIAIHLFNLRRYKTVYFSDTSFLKEIQQATKRQRKLKEWLVLFSRLLALTALVLAFARPYIPVNQQNQAAENVAIILDNSASTTAGLGDLQPFERGKQLAQQLAEELGDGTEVELFTASNQLGNAVNSKQYLTDFLQRAEPTDRSIDLLAIANNIKPNSTVYFISDLQKNGFLPEAFLNDSLSWVLLPTVNDDEAEMNNIGIDSVWVESPFLLAGQPMDAFIRFKNYNPNPAQVDLEILTNGLPEIALNIDIPGNADTTVNALLTQLKNGYNTLQINLPGNSVDFDNAHYRCYYLPIANKVIEIYSGEESRLLKRIFSGDEFSFSAMNVGNINNAALADADLIILNELPEINSGLEEALLNSSERSNLFLIPHAKAATALNDLCAKLRIRKYGALDTNSVGTRGINNNDPFFDDVFSGSLENAYWPTANNHFRISGSAQLPTFDLLTLNNGDPLFLRYANNQTNIFQLATPVQEAFIDLATHPVVVPMFIKALMRRNSISAYTGELGTNNRFDIGLKQNLGETPLTLQKNEFSIIPQQRAFGKRISVLVGEDLNFGGFYNLIQNDQPIAKLSFNSPAHESDIERFTIDGLNDFLASNQIKNVQILNAEIGNLKTVLREWQQGIQLWKYALVLALILILLEVILLRFLK